MGVLRRGSNGLVRKNGTAPVRGGTVHASVNAYSHYIGFHADEDNGLETPLLVGEIFTRCHVSPASMNGAPALWRHVSQEIPGPPAGDREFPEETFTNMAAQRAEAASLGCEEPTIIFVPFTNDYIGTNDAEQNAAVLVALAAGVALYDGENIIAGFGNLTSSNFMPVEVETSETRAARRAAWFILEAQAILIFEAAGLRWCSTDDQGISFLCLTIVERRAAWALAGIDPDDCYFFACHGYTDSGWVPAHWLLADASLARADNGNGGTGITTPIRFTELAFGFLGAGNNDADKPWLLTEYLPGNTSCPPGVGGSECPPHSVRWMRHIFRWCRANQKFIYPFDWTMFVRMVEGSPQLSSWGIEFTQDQDAQPAFVEPLAGTLWFQSPDAENLAYSLRLSNTDGGQAAIDAAEDAYTHVGNGNLFTIEA